MSPPPRASRSTHPTLVSCAYLTSGRRPLRSTCDIIRRLRRVMPAAKFLACFWMLDPDDSKLEAWRVTVGADLVASSIAAAARICLTAAAAATPDRGNVQSAAPHLSPSILP